MIDAVESRTEVERDEEGRIPGVRGGKNVIKSCEKASFSGMTRPNSVMKLVEVW